MKQLLQPSVTIPAAIILAGVLIAWAVFTGGGGSGSVGTHGEDFGNRNSASAESVRAPSNEDHVLGDRNAPIAVIEFSDFECPFCARLHPTLGQIVEDFPGEVQWVYRHFPLTQIHSRALQASLASECVAELGGNDAFWSFSDSVFSNQRELGNPLYERLAGELGIPADEFNQCLDERRHNDKVQEDFQEAVAAGGRGTPFSVVMAEDGTVFPFSGALPYEQIRGIIEQAAAVGS